MKAVFALFFLGLAALGGCHASYQQTDTAGQAASGVRLDRSLSVLVAVPKDGDYAGRTYGGSGVNVAQQTAAAFARYATRVQVASPSQQDRSELIAAAQAANAGYLVIPVITHWEPRATEWSGIPSRASFSLTVVDVKTGQDLTSSLLESRSRIFSWTRTSPESLLPELVRTHAAGLY
jgi:hypothetical protein